MVNIFTHGNDGINSPPAGPKSILLAGVNRVLITKYHQSIHHTKFKNICTAIGY